MASRAGAAFDVRRYVVGAAAVVAIGFTLELLNLVGHRQGNDYDVYHAAGSAVVHGRSLFSSWLATQMPHPLPFTYPPFAAVIAVPLGVLPNRVGFAFWTFVSAVLLALVVVASTKPLVARFAWRRVVLGVLVLVAAALTPVMATFGHGQLGIALMAMCLFDCLTERPSWPRGSLIGVATAIKLLPAIFIPYLWLTGRRRAAVTATATAVAATAFAWIVLPSDSHTFWTGRVLDNSRVGNNAFYSNQSLNGILRRLFGGPVQPLWLLLAVSVAVAGLRAAMTASRRGDELLGVCLAGLVAVAVSPVSWIHHLVWVVPALALIADDGRDRRRVVLSLGLAAFFALRLPYLGDALDPGWSWIAGPLKDAYGVACIVLLFTLPRVVVTNRPRAVPPARERAAPPSS